MKRMLICAALVLCSVMLTGCLTKAGKQGAEAETQPMVEEQGELGQKASYGGMTLRVISAEDPDITLRNGKKAIFIQVELKNDTEETIKCSYLNNFTLTVDGTFLEPSECCSIPAMKEMYDRDGNEALSAEIAPGESCTGFLAFEVEKDYQEIIVHFLPKTLDTVSRINVPISKESMTGADKETE